VAAVAEADPAQLRLRPPPALPRADAEHGAQREGDVLRRRLVRAEVEPPEDDPAARRADTRLRPVEERPTIGVLALQGNFREHAAMLRRLGAEVVEVRKPGQLEGLAGLVVPGGESTAIVRLMRLYGFEEALRRFERPVLGTCAGMILLGRDHLGLADLAVERNAYGRQVASFEADLELAGEDEPLRGVFIRAPRISEIGPGVEVLAEHDGAPVLVRDGRLLAASFHPELTDDVRVHERFLELVREETRVGA
jgi:5'-phosphate synthase pdxT subunit